MDYVVVRKNVAGAILLSTRLFTHWEASERVAREQHREDAKYDGPEELKWEYFKARLVAE